MRGKASEKTRDRHKKQTYRSTESKQSILVKEERDAKPDKT
jgi:hypothetical protein